MAFDETIKSRLMTYCRIDTLEAGEDLLLQTFYDAAVNYMEQAGISAPVAETSRRAQYDLCVNAMVLDAWDHRDMTEYSGQVTENPAFRQRLNQLKFSESKVSDSDT